MLLAPPSRGGKEGFLVKGSLWGLTGNSILFPTHGAGSVPALVAQIGLQGPNPCVFMITGSCLGLWVSLGGEWAGRARNN